jgi:hypothetical protein
MENNGQQAGKTSATVGDLRKQEGDLLYAMVLCFTFGQMGLIVWDMFALIPEFEELIGVPNPGRIHSFVEMTTLYLAFIGAYIGRNAWRKYQKKDDSEAVPHYVFQRIERGYFYMTVWGSLCFVS